MHGGFERKAVGRRATAAAWGSLLLAMTATACGAGTGDGPADRPREPTAAETALLDRAQEELVRRCMKKLGFRYWPAPPSEPDELKDFPLVVDDMAWARRHGYGGDLQQRAEKERRNDPNVAYVQGFSAARQQAYSVARTGDGSRSLEVTAPNGQDVGQDSTGCIAEAEGTLYGDFRAWFRVSVITDNLPDHSVDVRRDARFRRAVEEWSACMAKQGHPYKSPSHLQKELAKLTGGRSRDEAHRTEVLLATAEASCARSTPLAATVRSLTRNHDRAVREKYGSDIDAKRRMQLAALTRAREITGN
ncbi:hypothetical protein ACH4SP_00620 [Streptomyces sp. NPDC021093]|uniref:hypothetical protein n=1 Tax=Streptomyces sp. NPDC021093 TaxID=3365112 RepID=UPI0037A8570F